MIEIGVLFYSKDPDKDITKAIQTFAKRMETRPNVIYFPVHAYPKTFKPCDILAIKSAVLPENHFVLARED